MVAIESVVHRHLKENRVFVKSCGGAWGWKADKAGDCRGILRFERLGIWHADWMARRSQRKRRLWDAYCFPGFRPEPTVRGGFRDPKARVVRLNRRSKKPPAAVVVTPRWAGTTAKCAGCGTCPAATRGFSSNWRCGASTVAAVARCGLAPVWWTVEGLGYDI